MSYTDFGHHLHSFYSITIKTTNSETIQRCRSMCHIVKKLSKINNQAKKWLELIYTVRRVFNLIRYTRADNGCTLSIYRVINKFDLPIVEMAFILYNFSDVAGAFFIRKASYYIHIEQYKSQKPYFLVFFTNKLGPTGTSALLGPKTFYYHQV